MTRIGIIGSGHIGGNIARFLAHGGHDVVVSFSQDQGKLDALADAALEQAGGADALAGKAVLDTTNQFGQVGGRFGVLDLGGKSAAETNAARAPRAAWVKAFNTLTAGFQASSSGRTGPGRVVMFYATNADAAAPAAEALISDAGFDAVRTGTLARTDVGHQEPKGDLYGEEFHHDDAIAAVRRLRGTIPAGTGRP